MNHRSQTGFTFIELIIAMSISLILLGIGVPSFLSAVKNSKLSASYNAVVSSLYLARSEATKRPARVSVCARANDTTCGSNWSNGWILFTDNSVGSSAGTAGEIDGSDEILRVYEPLENMAVLTNATLNGIAPSAANAAPQSFVQYRPDGSTSWSSGTFFICDDRGETYARSTNLVLTGDIRKGRNATGEVPKDVNGESLVCPTL